MSKNSSDNVGCAILIIGWILGAFLFVGTPDLHDLLMQRLSVDCVQPGQKPE